MSQNTNNTVQEGGEWRGWADWLGVVNVWNRQTLLAFLEDLRPHLESLEEKELYAIIAQSGAMPALRGAFDKERPGRLIQDLKENEGREIEEAIRRASEEEIEDAALSGEEPKEEEVLGKVEKADAPPEDYLRGEDEPEAVLDSGALPTLATPDGLRAVDDIAALHYGLDDETAEFLVRNRVAALWNAYITHGPAPVQEALGGEGSHYFGLSAPASKERLRRSRACPFPRAGPLGPLVWAPMSHPLRQTLCSGARPTRS